MVVLRDFSPETEISLEGSWYESNTALTSDTGEVAPDGYGTDVILYCFINVHPPIKQIR